ncbi:MAG: PAS domain S-box protein, partial [Bacteroidia bacterium]|nr:PAS domain S-box protein [Bacteroidia bacterium]
MKSTISNLDSLNLLPVALVLFDNKKVYFVNKKAHQLLCLPSKTDLSKLNPFDFIHPDFHKRIKKNNTEILKGKEFDPVELKIKSVKNKFFFIEAKSNAVLFNGKKVVQSVFYEISERKNYYDFLINSNEILNLLGQNNSDILYKFDYLPTQKFSYLSHSFKKITGFDPKDVIKNTSFLKKLLFSDINYTLPSDKKKFINKYNNEGRVITPLKTKQNKNIWIESTLNVIKNEKQQVVSVIGIGRDVTQQKETESQLIDTQNQLHLIAKNAHDVIYFFTYQPKPKYLFISDSVERVLGYKPENFYKDPFFINKRTVGKNNEFKEHEKTAAKEQKKGNIKQRKIVYQIKNSAGELVWMEDHINPVFDEKGKLTFIFGIVRNINELKKKENELNQKWSDYKLLLDQSPIAFYIHDNGICLMCNKAGVDLIKEKSEKNIIGKFIINYIIPEQRKKAIERMKLAKEGKEWDFLNYTLTNKKGKRVNVEIKTVPITYNGKKCVLSLVKDISEREQAQKNKLRAELTEEANKLLVKEIALREEAEKKLIEQKNKLSAIFENSQHVVWTVNKNYELTYYNKNFEKLFFNKHGKKVKIGIKGDDFVPEKNKQSYSDFWYPHYKKAFKGQQLVFELKDATGDGTEIYREVFINPIYNDKGEITEISCMANDISGAKQQEKKLLEQSARIKTIFDSGHQTIWTVDTNFRYLSFNKNFIDAYKETYGQEPKINKCFLDTAATHPDALKISKFWEEKYNEVLKGKSIEFVVERKVLKGNTKTRRFYLQPIYNTKGEVIEISGLGREITQEVLIQQKTLNQAAKLNSIFEGSSHYVWTVDKDLNLTSFNRNYTELIKNVYNTTPVIGQPVKRDKVLNDYSYIKKLIDNYKIAFEGGKVNFEIMLEGANK